MADKFDMHAAFLAAATRLALIRATLPEQEGSKAAVARKFTLLGALAAKSVPYDFDNNAFDFVIDDQHYYTALENPALPFAQFWFKSPYPGAHIADVLLLDNGDKISATLFMYRKPDWPVERAEGKGLRGRLKGLGFGGTFSVLPDMQYDKVTQIVTIPHDVLIYEEAHDFGVNFLSAPLLDEMDFGGQKLEGTTIISHLVFTAIASASAVVKKSLFPALEVPPVKPPDYNVARALMRMGHVPKRKAIFVHVDLTKWQRPKGQTSEAQKQRERHWVGAYEYFKPSLNRIVKVPEHERGKKSSPVPAVKKPRIVRAQQRYEPS